MADDSGYWGAWPRIACCAWSRGEYDISTPEEVARLIAFVASPNNINGAEYMVDGGIIKNL